MFIRLLKLGWNKNLNFVFFYINKKVILDFILIYINNYINNSSKLLKKFELNLNYLFYFTYYTILVLIKLRLCLWKIYIIKIVFILLKKNANTLYKIFGNKNINLYNILKFSINIL